MSQIIADNALVILEGLGLLSSEYSFMDYVRGHYPDTANYKDQTYDIKLPITESSKIMKYNELIQDDKNLEANSGDNEEINAQKDENIKNGIPMVTMPNKSILSDISGKSDQEVIVSIPMSGKILGILVNKNEKETLDPDEKILKIFSNLGKNVPKNQELVFLSVLRAIDGLKNTNYQEGRLRIISLRVQCLLIVSHSRLSTELIHPYLKIGSVILKDLISISDISSESYAELESLHKKSFLSTVSIIAKCTLGLTEYYMKEKGPLLNGIIHELGLSKTGKQIDRKYLYFDVIYKYT